MKFHSIVRHLLLAGGVVAASVAALQISRSAKVSAEEPAAPAKLAAINYAPVETFLKANCIECHGPNKQKGDITLHIYHDAASVVKDRNVWETVLEKVRAGEMPPKKKPRPDRAMQEVFLRTIDQIFYQHDLLHPVDPGQVTIRRLNRTEYNNTIRDLCGVDSQPSEDFPSDDIGQGFDNIGDVLSISPVLMERYLSAAESIMVRAIPLEPPKRLDHHLDARFTEPALHGGELPESLNRPLTQGKSIYSRYKVLDDGEYDVRWFIYSDKHADEGEAPQVAILVDEKELKTDWVKIDADRKNQQMVSAKINLPIGEHRFEVALKNGWRNEPDWILRVHHLELIGPPETMAPITRKLLASDGGLSQHDKTRQILRRFARRAYRRTPTDAEVDHLVAFAEKAQADGQNWQQSISLAMQAALISPKFLFRVELDDRPDAAAPHEIDEFQLASRLSYFLWSTMPDDELLDLAEKKQLNANLEAQVRRMLQDKRADALVDNFAIQWLQLRRLKNFAPDAQMYPAFSERLRKDMLTETKLFVGSVFREDRSILDLIDADYTYLNPRLARFYGIGMDGKPQRDAGGSSRRDRYYEDETFQRVHLSDHSRGGVLTEASVLSVTSNPTRTSPVKRGKFVLEQILGTPPPPPPPNVPELKEIKTVENGGTVRISLRQRMQQHRSDPACANCHEKMDGLGFAFENFDAIGGYRTTEGGIDIDASGSMPDGESFRGAAELKSLLKDKSDMFSRCLAKKMLIYATGRGLEYYDNRAIDKIVLALKEHDYKFSTLVVEIAKSDPFRKRRGKDQKP